MATGRSTTTAPCSGCLDSRQCWVCWGAGATTSRTGAVQACRRCVGRGLCALCRPVPGQRAAS